MIVFPHQTGKHQQLKSYIALSVKENKNTIIKLSFYLAKHMFICCQQEPIMVSPLLPTNAHKIHTQYIRNPSGVFCMFSLYLTAPRQNYPPAVVELSHRVGYEMIESQRRVSRHVQLYSHLIFNNHMWNNCFNKNAHPFPPPPPLKKDIESLVVI